jgi:hypothetical protein
MEVFFSGNDSFIIGLFEADKQARQVEEMAMGDW